MTPIVAANNPNHWETRPRPATLNVLRRHAGAVAIASVSAARRRAELSVRSPTVASVFVADDQVIYSASDLAAAARCEYSLLRSFDAQLGWGPPAAVEDELLARTAKLGGEHEQRHLDELRSAADDTVAVIGRPPYTVAGLTAAAEATMRAVERRAPVIYQAAMFDGRFVGFADFLVFDGQQYRLRDTKLARSVKVEALLQLAAYADALTNAGVPVALEVELVLGDGATVSFRVNELLPVYRPRRAELERLLDGHLGRSPAVTWEDPDMRTCFRCPECTSRSARTTTCCSSPVCGSASGRS